MDEDVKGLLSDHEARVLGCLMEKQMTTPEYYPLTLKALCAACNQKSSRNPVMSLSEGEVGGVVAGLRSRGLITARMDGRADRFEQHLSRAISLDTKQRAILCVLLLRGLLTINEIRINTSRMVEFESNEAIQGLLDELAEREEPLVLRIPRSHGQREDRYAQLLCGEPDIETRQTHVPPSPSGNDDPDAGRIARLEQELADLKAEVQRLREFTGMQD